MNLAVWGLSSTFVSLNIQNLFMKKHTAIILAFVSLCSSLCYAAPSVKGVILRKIIPSTRSIEAVPEAYISNDILTVSFDGSGMYSLYIEDNFGVSVYSSALPANGTEYDYDLSGIGEGLFRLVISGPSGDYEGYFSIH